MSKNSSSISKWVIRRLPRYYRFLMELEKAGVAKISSAELSRKMGFTASQIRQDLNCFGGFGQQGYGYNVSALRAEIQEILGLNTRQNAILIGAGNLGKAVATHIEFEKRGLSLCAVFDNNPDLVGKLIGSLTVEDISSLEEICSSVKPSVAVLCIPKEAARSLADRLIALGIKGFWNFSHYDLLHHSDRIVVENVHLSDSLMTLNYLVKNTEGKAR